jgi:hypothetical protein
VEDPILGFVLSQPQTHMDHNRTTNKRTTRFIGYSLFVLLERRMATMIAILTQKNTRLANQIQRKVGRPSNSR